jgi:hypothetical protein
VGGDAGSRKGSSTGHGRVPPNNGGPFGSIDDEDH